MPLTVHHNFSYLGVLLQCLETVVPYLQSPTLLYHDGHNDTDIIAKTLFQSYAVINAKIPDRPNSDDLTPSRSAILLAKSPEPMVEYLRLWSVWRARYRVVVFLEHSSDVQIWIETLWKKTRAADILAVVLGANPPEYFTWFPYRANECSNVTTIVRINSSDLFPEKITPHLNKCPLIAVTTRSPPFVVNETLGTESRMFLDIVDKLGMTPRFVQLPPGLNIWVCFDTKQQPYSGLKLLFNNEIDVMFSQIAVSYRTADYADFTPPHATEGYHFLVPGPVEAPRTTAIFRALPPRAWLFVSIASIIIYLTVAVIPLIETGHLQSAFVHTIAIILNVPTIFPPSRALQFFAVAAYIYSMHITTAYTSSFIVFLSDVPRERAMTSIEDVAESGYKVQIHIAMEGPMNELSSSKLINAINQPERIIVVYRIDLDPVIQRKQIALAPKISNKVELQQDRYYDQFDYPRILIIEPAVFSSFLSFYVSKNHPLYERLCMNLLRLVEGGFPERYRNEVEKPDRPHLRNLEPFGVENVEGPFILHLCLLMCCIFAWCAEWICYWVTKKTKREKSVRDSQSARRKLRRSRLFSILSRQIQTAGRRKR